MNFKSLVTKDAQSNGKANFLQNIFKILKFGLYFLRILMW